MVRRKKTKYRLGSSKVSEVSTKNDLILDLIFEMEICQTKNKKKSSFMKPSLLPSSPHPFLLPGHNWGNKISIPSSLPPSPVSFCVLLGKEREEEEEEEEEEEGVVSSNRAYNMQQGEKGKNKNKK